MWYIMLLEICVDMIWLKDSIMYYFN